MNTETMQSTNDTANHTASSSGQFTISREAVIEPLQAIMNIVEKRNTLPILANALFEISDNMLTITGTDLEVQLAIKIALDDAIKNNFTFTASGKKLLDICRCLPTDANITIKQTSNTVTIASAKSRFSLATLPAQDFPLVNDADIQQQLSISQEQLKALIQRTHFAMAQQDVRYYLNGMLLDINSEGIKVVATDGHRLAVNQAKIESHAEQPCQIIIPRKGVIEMMRLLNNTNEKITLTIGKNHLQLSSSSSHFISKLVEGRFPDYNQVLPKGGDKELIIDRDTLKQALTRVSILANEKFRGVTLNLSTDQLTIKANNPEQEQAEESLTTAYEAEPLTISFNVNYLLDVLNTVEPGSVRLTLSTPQKSILIEEVGKEDGGNESFSLFVVMPMRI